MNHLTIPNEDLVLLMRELRNTSRGAKVLIRLNWTNSYNLLRIAAADESKTAFSTKQGLFKYTVIPFCQPNTPASFQEMMDSMFKDM